MPRPNSADLLAFQLEHAVVDKAGRISPVPMSAPPSSFGASPRLSSNDFSTPSTPATPWLDEFGSWGPTGGLHGKGLADDEPRAKLQSRGGTRHVEEEDETDEDLEDELADYGYGAPKRRKEKKETLMDILNSEPPSWMAQAPATATIDAHPFALPQPKRSATLSAKLRQRFGSTGPAPALPASDSLTGLSTLRTSSASQSSLPYVAANGLSSNLAESERAQARPARKLAAKDAASSAGASTRDLADFLRSSGPPDSPYGNTNSLPDKPSSLSLGSKPRSTLHKPRASVSKALGQLSARPAHTATSSEAGSLDAGTGGTAILKAAMVKLGTGGRRTSLTPLTKTVGASPGVAAQNGSVDADREGARSNDELGIGGFGCTPSVSAPVAEHRRRASADAASVMGIADFVATDERRRLELERTRLPVETRAGDLAERAAAAGLRRGASQRSATSLNQFSPPRASTPQRISRKPVPAAIPPIEELLAASSPPRPSSGARQSTLQSPQQLEDRGVASDVAAGDVTTNSDDRPAPLHSFQSLAPISPVTPLTPSTGYATPPVTPSPNSPGHAAFESTASNHARERTRTRTSDSTLSISATSRRVSLLAAAGAQPASPALQGPLPAPPADPAREDSRAASIDGPELRQGSARSPPLPALATAVDRAKSPDSLLDPPLTAGLPAPAQDARGDRGTAPEDPLVAALEALQICLRTASAVPLSLDAAAHDARAGEDLVQAVVPVLHGLCEQMRRGAHLVEEVLVRLEARRHTTVDVVEADEGEMGRAVEAVLVGVDSGA